EVQGNPHYICNGADAPTNPATGRFTSQQLVNGVILSCGSTSITPAPICIDPLLNGLPLSGDGSGVGLRNTDTLCFAAIGTNQGGFSASGPAQGDYYTWNGQEWTIITGTHWHMTQFHCPAS